MRRSRGRTAPTRATLSPLVAILTCVLAEILFAGPGTAWANEVTEVIDAGDEDDPFDFVGGVTYRRSFRRAKITREYNCNPSIRTFDAETCPSAGPGGELVHVKELRYERVTHEMVPEARFGLWHDLELKIEAPIVISDEQSYRYAGNGGDADKPVITPDNSSIAPGDGEDLFPVPSSGLPTRAGFGDMLFMLRYSPVAQERDDQRGDWTVELGYRAPTGEVMKRGNEGVGRGVHELIVATSLSRKYRYVDPYVRIEGAFPFAAGGSQFKDYGDSQEHVGPGGRGTFQMGSEMIPYEDPANNVKVFIDLGLGATYNAEGRDYSELFDAIALGSQDCDPSAPGGDNCARFNPDSRSELANEPHDGLTTVEEHVTLRSHVGLGVHASKFARLGLQVGFEHDSAHYISAADIGKDLDGSGLVEARNTARGRYDPAEHNPTYSPAIDALGRRIRIEETTVFTFAANLKLTF